MGTPISDEDRHILSKDSHPTVDMNPDLEDVLYNPSEWVLAAWTAQCRSNVKTVSFDSLLETLGMGTLYESYIVDMKERIDRAADSIFGDASFERDKTKLDNFYGLGRLMWDFKQYFQKACDAFGRNVYTNSIVDVDEYPVLYTDFRPGLAIVDPNGVCGDHTDRVSTDSTSLHIPVVFGTMSSKSGIGKDALELMCPCVRAMWIMQPTRIYIPVFYVNGYNIELLVFTRTSILRTRLGPMFYKQKSRFDKFLRQFLFFAFQRLEYFGHYCRTNWGYSYTLFAHAQTSDDQAGFRTVQPGGVMVQETSPATVTGDDVQILSAVHWETSGLFGPHTVIYYSFSHNIEHVYFVIYWQPVADQSGGGAMDGPPTEQCRRIRDFIDCGVIVPEFMGYTLRYAVFQRRVEPLSAVVDKVNAWKAALGDMTPVKPEDVSRLLMDSTLPSLEPSGSFTAVELPPPVKPGTPPPDNQPLKYWQSRERRNLFPNMEPGSSLELWQYTSLARFCMQRSATLVDDIADHGAGASPKGKEVDQPFVSSSSQKRAAPPDVGKAEPAKRRH